MYLPQSVVYVKYVCVCELAYLYAWKTSQLRRKEDGRRRSVTDSVACKTETLC